MNQKRPCRDNYKIVSNNRKARFNYSILDTVEAGMSLLGSEVKSARLGGNVSLQEGYVEIKEGEAFLVNCFISEYSFSGYFSHEPTRSRKLLLHKKQILKLSDQIRLKGMTIVPLKMYFNQKGLLKLEIALAKGKDLYDKRQALKDRMARKEADLAIKNYNKNSY